MSLVRPLQHPTAMEHDFFDPIPEQQHVVLVNAVMLRNAEKLINSCEHCNARGRGDSLRIGFSIVLLVQIRA